MTVELTAKVKQAALDAGADIVGIASIDRFEHAPPEMHPRGIFLRTQSVIVMGCRMVRGALKAVEEGQFWQAYNCDSYQYINEVLAPHMLRKVVNLLEDLGYSSVPLHNPFGPSEGRPVAPGRSRPDGMLSLRLMGVAAGLGEIGRSKLFLSKRFGPRNRMYAIYTDAVLTADPLVPPGTICDDCGLCRRCCPPEAIGAERSCKMRIGPYEYSHAPLDTKLCGVVHRGFDPRYSPFVTAEHTEQSPPKYYKFLKDRFRHHGICGGRGCVRACMDHLEKTGRIEQSSHVTPMIEGSQWVLPDL